MSTILEGQIERRVVLQFGCEGLPMAETDFAPFSEVRELVNSVRPPALPAPYSRPEREPADKS